MMNPISIRRHMLLLNLKMMTSNITIKRTLSKKASSNQLMMIKQLNSDSQAPVILL